MPSLRKLAERLSRHISFTRSLPARAGGLRLHISPAAALTYWLGLDRPSLNDLYDFSARCVQSGQIVWDVGANLGVFTFAALARTGATGQVHAFEPDPWARQHLETSRRLNPDYAKSTFIHPFAISNLNGEDQLRIPVRGRAAAHLASTGGGAGDTITGGVRKLIPAQTRTLDSLLDHLPAPSVLKIDIDGGEASALSGATRLLTLHRPAILVEVHDRNSAAVLALLTAARYTLFNYDQGEAACVPVAHTCYQTLAIPTS